jgi:hypothetical protein
MELSEGKPGSPVNGHKETELALDRLHLGDVVVEVADRIASERLLAGLVGRQGADHGAASVCASILWKTQGRKAASAGWTRNAGQLP